MLSDEALRRMAHDLVRLDGIRAVTLGGSRARGTHRPDSDADLGLYYDRGDLDLAGLSALAARWSGRAVAVHEPGSWGAWVDGGAWLEVDGAAVDWLLRDVERVEEQCRRAVLGEHAFAAQAGHPLGFLDVAYAGEVASAVLLEDPQGVLATMRERITPYPPALRAALVADLWQVDFLLDGAVKGAKRGDAAYVTLCMSHAVLLLAHGWHATAGAWVTNEKGLVPQVEALPLDSRGFSAAAASALGSMGTSPSDLAASIESVRALPRPDAGV